MMHGESFNVEVATLDAFHERSAVALNSVRAGLVEGFPSGHVSFDDVIGQVVEGDFCGFVKNTFVDKVSVATSQQNDAWIRSNCLIVNLMRQLTKFKAIKQIKLSLITFKLLF